MTSCPSCGASLPSSAIAEAVGAARCPACRALIDLDSTRVLKPRAAIATPEKWEVEATPGSLRVRWRWFSWAAVFLVPFTLFWNGIMLTMAAGFTEGFTHPERLVFGLAIPHVWVGLGLGYYCLTLFFNSTTVNFAEGTLQVTHGPLPWWGKRRLPVRELSQLFVVEKRGSKGSLRYEVCGLLADGKRVSILSGLNDEAQARFLEVRLEQALGIVDRPVAGELRAS